MAWAQPVVWSTTSQEAYTIYVQIFAAHNFRGFRGFLKSAKIKLAKFLNTYTQNS